MPEAMREPPLVGVELGLTGWADTERESLLAYSGLCVGGARPGIPAAARPAPAPAPAAAAPTSAQEAARQAAVFQGRCHTLQDVGRGRLNKQLLWWHGQHSGLEEAFIAAQDVYAYVAQCPSHLPGCTGGWRCFWWACCSQRTLCCPPQSRRSPAVQHQDCSESSSRLQCAAPRAQACCNWGLIHQGSCNQHSLPCHALKGPTRGDLQTDTQGSQDTAPIETTAHAYTDFHTSSNCQTIPYISIQYEKAAANAKSLCLPGIELWPLTPTMIAERRIQCPPNVHCLIFAPGQYAS